MKTKHIVSALRAAATPAARLAAWQAIPIRKRLEAIRTRLAPGGCTYACNVPMPADPKDAKLADWRRALIHDPAFYLTPIPYVYSSEATRGIETLVLDSFDSREVRRAWDCKDRECRTWLDHNGWFTDEFQSETIRAAVVELVRFPGVLFAATVESCGGMISVDLTTWETVDFSDCASDYDAEESRRETARSVMRSADSIAERLAESEREYQRKWRIENDISENRETLKTLRGEIRALAWELKRLCPSPLAGEYPAATSAVRGKLSDMLRERAELFAENQKLATEL